MNQIIKGPDKIKIKYADAVYLPFRGKGFSNTYYQDGPFNYDLNNFEGGTCGPDAIFIGNQMIFFLTDLGGNISSNGKEISIEIPEKQKLLIMDDERSESERWSVFKNLVEIPKLKWVPRQRFWYYTEYVTWVEQRYFAEKQNRTPREVLDEKFVLNYIKRINMLGFPKGKLTIDDGWQQINNNCDSEWTDGYWKPDRRKFPHFETMIQTIEQQGFIPSLWMGIPSVPMQAKIIQDHPELFVLSEINEGMDRIYYKPCKELIEHFKNILRPYIAMGIRKFKFDFFYGKRQRMRDIMKCLNQSVREIDSTVEIESHHADPFFSCYCDTFRMNDVHTEPGLDWRGLTMSHIYLGNHEVTGCILNLDHLGANSPFISEEAFAEHAKLFDFVKDRPRYPVLSLLPDRYTEDTINIARNYIKKHTISFEQLECQDRGIAFYS